MHAIPSGAKMLGRPPQDMEKLPRDQLCRESAAKQAFGFSPEHVGGSAGGY